MDEMTRKSFERAMAERKADMEKQCPHDNKKRDDILTVYHLADLFSSAASKEGYNAHAFAEIYEQACHMSRKWFAL